MTRSFTIILGFAATAVLASCQDRSTGPEPPAMPRFSMDASESPGEQIARLMDEVNVKLAAQDASFRAAIAEYITVAGTQEAGATIIARDLGNKRLAADFVPFDPRRAGWSGAVDGPTDDIRYAIDQTIDAVPPSGLPAEQTTAAIQRAMASWDAATCSSLPVVQTDDFGLDLGVFAFQLSNGAVGGPFVVADIMHAGWRDLDFSGGTLAATVTFVFTEGGVPTDIDGNGKDDVAFREIYYDPSWIWNIDGNIDVESVALHEAGHALSQAHFGNIMLHRDALRASPRAVMNALYSEPLQTLLGTDVSGHCGLWATWPNR